MPRAITIALLILASAFGQSTLLRTPQDSERAEQELAANPGDLKLRTDLIVYYYRFAFWPAVDEAALQRRVEHILWLVEHHPEATILGKPEGMVEHAGDRRANAAAHAKAGAIWRKHTANAGAAAAVMANAGYFFRLTDREFGATLLTRALRLKPDESAYSEALGLLYAEAALGVTEEFGGYAPNRADRDVARSAFAKRARSILSDSKDTAMLREAAMEFTIGGISAKRQVRLDYDPFSVAESLLLRARRLNPTDDKTLDMLGRHYSVRAIPERNRSVRASVSRKWLNVLLDHLSLAKDSYQRSRILMHAAKAAYLAEQVPAASDYARQALAVVQPDPNVLDAGDVVHGANTVLGLVAAGRGDMRAAALSLIASAKVRRTPVLISFGPSMIVAKTLLENDERKPVLEYLRLCAGFWTSGTEELEQWTKQVQAGQTPNFGRLSILR